MNIVHLAGSIVDILEDIISSIRYFGATINSNANLCNTFNQVEKETNFTYLASVVAHEVC